MTDKIEACAAILRDSAIERAQENPELTRADFESFCKVMWTDDGDMKRAGLTREEFRIALQSAWMKCRSRRRGKTNSNAVNGLIRRDLTLAVQRKSHI